ncbi:uncharacterized protein [Argopecten irradians]|uniref:uncharacterized protein isoform X2 n=1 Tax=Argopecten irradians TaxID=31199 RepID=UPI00371DC84B
MGSTPAKHNSKPNIAKQLPVTNNDSKYNLNKEDHGQQQQRVSDTITETQDNEIMDGLRGGHTQPGNNTDIDDRGHDTVSEERGTDTTDTDRKEECQLPDKDCDQQTVENTNAENIQKTKLTTEESAFHNRESIKSDDRKSDGTKENNDGSEEKSECNTEQSKKKKEDDAENNKINKEDIADKSEEKKVDNADRSDGNLIRGLPNVHSSTCYISSLIQVLAQTPGFMNKLISSNQQSNHVADILIRLFVDINDMKQERSQTEESLYTLVVDLQDSMSKRDGCFSRGNQNDCHSLYLCLINALEEEIEGSVSLFEGQIRHMFWYSTCDHVEKSSTECFRSLLLPVENSECSMEDGLEMLEEIITFDGAQVPCSICLDEETITYKQSVKETVPEILVLQLARFKQDEYGNLYKHNGMVHYPTSLFLTVSCTQESSEKVNYDLYGVICHEGDLEKGHYWCYVKKDGWNPDNIYLWHLCADSYVRRLEVMEEWPDSPFAYLLFYKQSEPRQNV